MVNCKLCSWCFEPIDSDYDDFVINKEWDFLHVTCYREYDVIFEQVQSRQSEDKSLKMIRDLVSQIGNSTKEN